VIKEISNANETVTANGYELQKLKQALPQCFTSDGSFNMEAFKAILDGNVNITNESYELKFLGKSYARLLASLDTETIIVPNEEHNSKPENVNSENIYITGDNLDALKHLLKSYEGKVKCIYIDPPYNTDSERFVYSDRFGFTKDKLVKKLSIDEEQADRILNLISGNSAAHSGWLTFMFPRLFLARDLLTKDGAIFISIDDNEYANLKLLCDYLYGEENLIASFCKKGTGGKQDSTHFAKVHEYILCYANSKYVAGEEVKEESKYPYFDEVENKYYKTQLLRKWGDAAFRSDRPHSYYPLYYYDGIVSLENFSEEAVAIYPMIDSKTEGRWRWGINTMREAISKSLVEIKVVDGNYIAYEKIYEPSDDDVATKLFSTWIDGIKSNTGKKLLKELFGEKTPFDYPKPLELLTRILQMGNVEDDIVLDFFSGSATTAHAVMKYNVENGINNKFIMIQLAEPTKINSAARKVGYETIDQIGRERIIRAAAKIKEEHPGTTADLGFKHYVLQDVPEKKLIELEDFDPNAIFAEEKILEYFTKPTVLTTWLVKDGYGFNANIEELKLGDYTAHYCDNHLYFLDTDFDDEAMKALYEKYDAEIPFKPENIVLFGYSFTYSQTALLKDNLKKLKAVEDNKNVNVIVRY